MSDIHPELLNFIEKKLWKTEKPLKRDSSIEDSHGIAGLDTILFYQDFITQFRIAVPNTINISNHVTPEGIFLLHRIKRIFSKRYREITQYVDLTVGDLEDMIKIRKWIEVKRPA